MLDAGASVLLDEATLWPNGKFPTTVMIVRTEFLEQYPDTVRALLRGHLTADRRAPRRTRPRPRPSSTRACRSSPATALAGPVIDRAFENITLDPDPLAATFPQLAKDSATAGVTEQADRPGRASSTWPR